MLKKLQIQLQNKHKKRVLISIGVVIAMLLIFTTLRIWAAIMLNKHTNQQAISVVNTVIATNESRVQEIVLPGNVSAWHEAPIYARTNGYVKNWYVDIGDHVEAGDLLAEIETPELDAQLRQAEADLNVVIANNRLAQSTATRWIDLLKSDSVSQQETDEKVESAHALAASVIAATANRDRLRDLVGFKRLTAPFSGTITARAIDIGALINSGSDTSAKPLFRVAQTDRLRAYVKIPETYASRITPKMQVQLQFAEHPGQLFKATLLQTAKAFDPNTRTLLAEFIVNNKKGTLLPGGYTEAHFKLTPSAQTIRLPVNTLLFRAQGLQVAILDKHNRVQLKAVTIARDFGTEVEINTGIKAGTRVIINPSDSLMNGEQVRIASAAGEKKSTH